MRTATLQSISLGGRKIDYRVIPSKRARKLRVRVGLDGVEVVQPATRQACEVTSFLRAHEKWISNQLDRVERFRSIRRPKRGSGQDVLFRGMRTSVHIDKSVRRKGSNRVVFDHGRLVIICGRASHTPPTKSLENWLRRQARGEIEQHLAHVSRRLKRFPNRLYVMGQRTKWGNCSRLGNLSFNWRLIMAPDFVLRYLVTHEAVHLAVPDHSRKFWLTVKSLCPETERARQWLSANGRNVFVDLTTVLGG
jgi:predicted metal-dependent hydrolase